MFININLINSLNLEVIFWGKIINLFGIPIKSNPKKEYRLFL